MNSMKCVAVNRRAMWLRWLGLALISTFLVACGGGGGGTDGSGTPPFGGPGSGGTGGGTSATPTVTVSISSTVITPQTPATVTVVVRDAAGVGVAGSVVTISTVRSDIGSLSAPTALTDSTGTAKVGLSVAASGIAGADSVIAVATLGTTTVQGRVGFTASGASATVIASVSSTLLKVSNGPATFSASVRDATGAAVAGQIVSFSAAGGGVVFGASSVRSDSLGIASTTVLPKDASVNAAETLIATATVGGKALQSSVSVQLAADIPSLALTVSSSNVSSSQPATVHALLKDSNGNLVPSSIVTFSSQFGLGTFDALTALTDVSGQATVTVSPKTTTTSGADYIVARATVGGVSQTAQTAVQFSAGAAGGTPVLKMVLNSNSITSGSPAIATATLQDSKGNPVPGQVVTFSVVRGLGKTSLATALTNAVGQAAVSLVPTSSTVAGADEITASASYAGASLQSTLGFQIQATSVSLTDFSSPVSSLSAYGQTSLTVTASGASVGSPVNISVSSACVLKGKATLSPSTFTTTTATTVLQYKDNGCGALQTSDQLQALVVGTSNSKDLSFDIQPPSVSSLAFVSSVPEVIYLKGSGFAETSFVTFEVRDSAGNPLANQAIQLSLMTQAGGILLNGGTADVVQNSDALGRVTVRINSGIVPTPVRVSARLQGNPKVTTVSSNLGIAVGLPSQLNFSLAQGTRNIEGFNIDGTPNTYQILAADRSGNPAPDGTTINFVTYPGLQVEAIKQTKIGSDGIAHAVANAVSSSTRPEDGRVTVVAYALGEESFIDLNGNNVYDAGEPFQDLGNIFKDRNYDGTFDSSIDEYISLDIDNASACVPLSSDPRIATLFALDAYTPSVGATTGSTCDGVWSGISNFGTPPNLVYVRRAVQTVLSTSDARPMWASTSGLTATCSKTTLQIGPHSTDLAIFTQMQSGAVWYGGQSGTLVFYASDANPGNIAKGFQPRFNPLAAGTTISASTTANGLKLTVGGSPVPSTTEPTLASIAYSFDPAVNTSGGPVNIDIKSPSGLITTYTVFLVINTAAPSSCPP